MSKGVRVFLVCENNLSAEGLKPFDGNEAPTPPTPRWAYARLAHGSSGVCG